MKTLRLFILALVLAIPARAQVHLLVTTNGLIIAPPDFFGQNISDLTNALNSAGYAPGGGGGGTGNASTNASQAWASDYTNTANGRWVFNGDVLAGSTNLVQKLASIELSLLGYQPASANLTNLAALNGAGITNLNATTAFSSGTVPIARLASGTPDGTKFIRDDGTLAVPSSSGVSLAGTNAWTGPNSFSADTTVSNMTVNGAMSVANISAGSIALSSPLGMANGGTGGTNASSARSSLGVTYDTDVQAYRLGLLQAALALTADGHMVYHNGTLVTNLATTSAGRALLTAASASAQWNNYLLAVASTNGAYDSTSWNGVSDRLVTLDQFRDYANSLAVGSNSLVSVTAPLSLTNGVLSIDTSGLGGGGGGISYLYAQGPSSFTSRADSTNWYLAQYTISSNDVPSSTGKYLMGDASCVISNYSGTTATIYWNVDVAGTRAYRGGISQVSPSGFGRPIISKYLLVRESETTASLVNLGGSTSFLTPDAGIGVIGGNMMSVMFLATNIPVNWSSNVTLDIVLTCDTSTSTNAALGARRVQGSLIKLVESTGGGTGNVVGPASSTDGNIPVFMGTTGKALTNSPAIAATNVQTITAAVAAYEPLNANKYQSSNSVLTTLATLNGSALTNLNATSIASGTLSSNRLPSAVAFTSMSVGTISATSVTGDASGLTGINGTNVTAGTVAAARLDSAMATDSEVAAGYQPLDSDLTALAAGTAMATAITNAVSVGAPTVYVGTTNTASALAGKAPLASPALTGTPTVNGTNLMAEVDLKAPKASPVLTNPHLTNSIRFGQSDLSAHSAGTNFVVDPTVNQYQLITISNTNAVRFLHLTNAAIGRQTTVIINVTTNTTVTVALGANQFANTTNLFSLTQGQILPISFYCYGSNNTNVIASVPTLPFVYR